MQEKIALIRTIDEDDTKKALTIKNGKRYEGRNKAIKVHIKRKR